MPVTCDAATLGFPTSDALRFLPEGPIPLGDAVFSWVAIQHGAQATAGSLNLYDLNTNQNQTFDLPGRPGFAIPCRESGKFVIGLERSLGIYHTADQSWTTLCNGVDADVDNTIINDGVAYDDNLVFGTKDLEFATQKAGLYLYRGRDQQLVRLRNDQICSNGKALIPHQDGTLQLLDIDSPTRTIVEYVLDIDAGKLSEPRVVIDLTDDPAVPDGMILSPDGNGVIVAMFHPGDVEHGQTRLYDRASGQLQQVWQTPQSRQNTCPALVPHQGKLHLVITTAVENMTAEDLAKCPQAGEIFVAPTDWESAALETLPRFNG